MEFIGMNGSLRACSMKKCYQTQQVQAYIHAAIINVQLGPVKKELVFLLGQGNIEHVQTYHKIQNRQC